MIAYGTFIAFLGDWAHETRLCVRIPSQGVLLISEPIDNPVVPKVSLSKFCSMSWAAQEELTINQVIAKLDNDDHPWAEPKGAHLLDIMAGASLITLRLACKASSLKYPDEIFQTYTKFDGVRSAVSEIDASWKTTLKKHTAKKKEAIDKLRRQLNKDRLLPVQERQDPPDDQDDEGPPLDRGVSGLSIRLVFCTINSSRSEPW